MVPRDIGMPLKVTIVGRCSLSSSRMSAGRDAGVGLASYRGLRRNYQGECSRQEQKI
jgi:hypothetical protein